MCQRNERNDLFFFLFEGKSGLQKSKIQKSDFPRWQPTLEFTYNPGKRKKIPYFISLLLFTSSLLSFSFLNLKMLHSSFFLPRSGFFCFMKSKYKWSQFLAEKTLLVSSVTLFSISGYLEQSHPCPERKHTHTDGISAWKRNTKSKWFWSYLLYQYKLSPFSLIHLIAVIFKHNEITLYYLKFNWNHRVFKWTKRYIPIKQIS